ncbi:helix-turn-helix domain-containing protein [Paenibacillus sp. sptzw28]|uniref:helix-turn-helix domain-containing protein n=1 Tax=Paenibacillus sp. sptzw28 TaxID=715179 RepID=UPI001C6F0150|nr:helix-turn-helix transcriptional regulator [Paenibacillus sp. sptzw28]QYR20836.1 helix-turn-helix domain-containing protein [Paenibacillus sp. sptzw28]
MERGKLTEYELELRKSIGRNLRRLLKENRMTQKQLSEATDIPTSTISDYLNAKSLAVPGNIQKMAIALKVSKEKIDPSFGGSEESAAIDLKMQFFEELERDLGIDLTDPSVQKALKRAAKIFFTDED